MVPQRASAIITAAAIFGSPAVAANVSTDRILALYKNGTNLNKKYPHGLGKFRARDRTSGTPVTTFRRSTRLYNLAIRARAWLG